MSSKKGVAGKQNPQESTTHDDSRLAVTLQEVANVHPRFDTEEDGRLAMPLSGETVSKKVS